MIITGASAGLTLAVSWVAFEGRRQVGARRINARLNITGSAINIAI